MTVPYPFSRATKPIAECRFVRIISVLDTAGTPD